MSAISEGPAITVPAVTLFRGTRPAGLPRLRRNVWRAVQLGLAATVLAVATSSAAPAQTGPIQPAPPGSGTFLESWALAPTGTDPSQPSSRPNLSYALARGAAQNDSVSVWNYSDKQLTFHVYATDAYNDATGEFALLPGDHKAKDAGSWVKLVTNFVTVPSRTRIDIPFTTTVPPNASPGDHAAGIIASLPTATANGNGQRITVDRRTGSRVYIRVAGPIRRSLVVENTSTKYHGTFNPLDGNLAVTYTLRNAGNVRLGARQTVTAKDLFGHTDDTHKLRVIPEVLPGNSITFHETLHGVPASLRVGATINVTPIEPIGAVGKPPAAESVTSHAWAIPWTLLLLLALIYLVWRLYRRYQDAHDAPPLTTQGGPNGSGPPRPDTTQGGAPRRPESVLRFTRRAPRGAGGP